MEGNNILSGDLLHIIKAELSNHNHWMVYNTLSSVLEKSDMHFFSDKDEAHEFAISNLSDYDSIKIIYARSISDVMRQIYGSEDSFMQKTENPDANGLYNPDGNAFTDAWIDHMERQQLLNNNLKTNFMNQKNFEYLSDQVKFTGFGEGLENELKEKMQKQIRSFR